MAHSARATAIFALAAVTAALCGCNGLSEFIETGVAIAEVGMGAVDEEDRGKVRSGLNAVKSLVGEIDTAEEIALGQSLAARTFASYGKPHPDAALTRYVATVGKLVALQSERPSMPFSFAVVEEEKPNALSLPGGYVFVSTGLLKELRSESELAAVLGHEIAHVAQKHGVEITVRDWRIGSVMNFAEELDEDAGKYREFVDLVYNRLAKEGYDKTYEDRADLAGTSYALRAGYHPEGLLPFLRRSAGSGGQISMENYRTHPDPGARIAGITRYLQTAGDYSHLPKLEDRYAREVLARLK